MESTNRVDPRLHREVARFGARDLTACMSCGVCTATCELSSEGAPMPRRIIHLLQIGHRKALDSSLEPWLCYYCGDCSASCPRDANPGETMMAARRYLTASYDVTGLSRRFYTSQAWLFGAMGLVAAAVVMVFVLFHGPAVTSQVELNTFAPVLWVEAVDWAIGGALLALLLLNASRMVRAVLQRDNIPFGALVREVWTFAVNFATQPRWRQCSTQRHRWVTHVVIVSGYVTMMVLVIGGLRWFQTDAVHPIYHPTRLFGYLATAALIYGAVDVLKGRLRRREPIHRFSEASDWAFPVLLLLVAVTGILVHVLRLAGMPLATYTMYVAHMALVAPMLIVEVPFGKWSHMLYRPLAVALAAARDKARASVTAAEDLAA